MALDGEKSVLVVDDDEFVRKVVMRQFEELGVGVATAGNGEDARQALRERGPFDLVVCDLQMPGVDGVELLRDFAALQPSAALALMSGVDAQTLEAAELLARTRELRYLGSLRKPVGPAMFKSLLQRLGETGVPAAPAREGEAPPVVTPEELRAAITAGEIDVYAQPKVDAESGALVGAEVLARWKRRDGIIVPPSLFIDSAEQWGLMPDLTDLVVRQAFAGCASWRAMGLSIKTAVNIPGSCLGTLDLPERIGAEALRYELNPRQIILEVTESALTTDLARLLDVVTRLRLRGFHLSVDDFGTGYSSLQRLKRLPFTELKIDRSFVCGSGRDAKLRSIVESTVRLARALHLSTCAEGVETLEDLDVVREAGCDLVQGYAIAKPMPKSELPGWAARRLAGVARLDPDAELGESH